MSESELSVCVCVCGFGLDDEIGSRRATQGRSRQPSSPVRLPKVLCRLPAEATLQGPSARISSGNPAEPKRGEGNGEATQDWTGQDRTRRDETGLDWLDQTRPDACSPVRLLACLPVQSPASSAAPAPAAAMQTTLDLLGSRQEDQKQRLPSTSLCSTARRHFVWVSFKSKLTQLEDSQISRWENDRKDAVKVFEIVLPLRFRCCSLRTTGGLDLQE